jgi:acyl-CoA thioesterase-1
MSAPTPGPADGRLTVLFLGDSFVAGVGDPSGLGWTTRLVADARGDGADLTAYPLGVRGNTSADVLARWERETAARLPGAGRTGIVVSFGVNDVLDGDDGRRRVPLDETVANLRALLDGATQAGSGVLVVGPPPVDDEAANARVAEVDARVRAEAAAHGVTAVPVLDALLADATWMAEVAAGDGAHPGADGYARLAALVRPVWRGWLAGLGGPGRTRS